MPRRRAARHSIPIPRRCCRRCLARLARSARIRLTGEIPSRANPPSGCVFYTRCPRYIGGICKNEEPDFNWVEPGHFWRCHYSADELRNLQRVASDREHTA